MIHDLSAAAAANSLAMTGTDYPKEGHKVSLSNSDLSSSSSPTPSPDPRPNRKPGRPVNPLPRHKRDSHINAEHRRRNKIKKGFETLKTLVPSLQDSSLSLKESKASMLFKAVEHCRQIQAECKAQLEEACALRQELGSLNEDIEKLQAQLPDSGVDRVRPPCASLKEMFAEYITTRTKENWKFSFFSYLIRPLFESYNKMVNTETMQNFLETIHQWRESKMSLASLRQGSLASMLQISTQTGIMDEPGKVASQLNEDVIQSACSPDKEVTSISTEAISEMKVEGPLSYLPSLNSSLVTTSTYAAEPGLALLPASASTSTSASTSSSSTFSSSSSFSNPSNPSTQTPLSMNFLAPNHVDDLVMGASAASTAASLDLSFLDSYTENYNNPSLDQPNEEYSYFPIPTGDMHETSSFLWEDVPNLMPADHPFVKDKPEVASQIINPAFSLSSFDLMQFTNTFEAFPSHNQTSIPAHQTGKFIRKV